MKIAYCTNVRLPSERAHGHQVAQVCDALQALGHAVTIFSPFRKNVITESYWHYYHASDKVRLEYIGTLDPIASPWLPGVLGLFWMNAQLRAGLATHLTKDRFDVLYTRSPALLPALLRSGLPTILELHQLPNRAKMAFVAQCNCCRIVACLTSSMKATLISWGVQPGKLIVAGDAVDLSRFAQVPAQDSSRAALNIHTNRHVIGYVGRLKTLSMEKGVGVLLQALSTLKETGKFFGLIVGGPKSDQEFYEVLARNLGLTSNEVMFTGEVPAGQVPTALYACDVLAMPFPDLPHYRFHMSPLKMFEYMAADRPIITTDLPTIRDVLDESCAYFCHPGSPQDLARVLQEILDHPGEAQQRAAVARAKVEDHTWEKRMQQILSAAKILK